MFKSWSVSVISSLTLSLFAGIIFSFSFISSFVSAIDIVPTPTIWSFSKDIISRVWQQESTVSSTRELLLSLCESFPETNAPQDLNARDSIFLALLCADLDTIYKKPFNEAFFSTKEWFVKADRKNIFTGCYSTYNDCRVEKKISDLYDDIINDLIDLSLSRSYGVTNVKSDKEEREKLIQAFTMQYFWEWAILCDTKTNTCPYPKTYNRLERYIQNMQNIPRRMTIIDAERLFDNSLCPLDVSDNTTNNTINNTEGERNKDTLHPLLCAWNEWVVNHGMLQVVYNELLWYSIVMETMSLYAEHTTITIDAWSTSDIRKKELQQYMYAQELQTMVVQRQAAMKTSLRLLNQTIFTFPQHIALQTMYEWAIWVRASLAQLYPTFVWLYDKMTDVQEM